MFASGCDGVLVTVLVVTYNGARRLGRCLDAVVQRGWLRALLEPFDDATAGAVAGKLLLEPRFVSAPLRAEGVDRLGLVSVTRDGEDVTAALV